MKPGTAAGLLLLASFLAAPPCGAATKSRLVASLEAGRKQVIVVYGTSLTAAGAWVTQLDDTLKKRFPGRAAVINSGGSGMWSQWGVENLDARVIRKNPDAVFIEFCINDAVTRFHCPVAQSRRNLEAMLDGILKARPQCEIILMTMTPGDKHPAGHASHREDMEPYNAMYRDVARQRGLMLIDHHPAWKALQTGDRKRFDEYVPDSIHPTAAGCAAIVTPAILEALGLSAR